MKYLDLFFVFCSFAVYSVSIQRVFNIILPRSTHWPYKLAHCLCSFILGFDNSHKLTLTHTMNSYISQSLYRSLFHSRIFRVCIYTFVGVGQIKSQNVYMFMDGMKEAIKLRKFKSDFMLKCAKYRWYRIKYSVTWTVSFVYFFLVFSLNFAFHFKQFFNVHFSFIDANLNGMMMVIKIHKLEKMECNCWFDIHFFFVILFRRNGLNQSIDCNNIIKINDKEMKTILKPKQMFFCSFHCFISVKWSTAT